MHHSNPHPEPQKGSLAHFTGKQVAGVATAGFHAAAQGLEVPDILRLEFADGTAMVVRAAALYDVPYLEVSVE